MYCCLYEKRDKYHDKSSKIIRKPKNQAECCSAIVKGKDLADMRAQPSAGSHLQWRMEAGVIGLLGECKEGWCQFDADGHKAFAPADRLWGAGEP